MERQSISIHLKSKNQNTIEYYYEGRLTPDFTDAGIIEFDREVLKRIDEETSLKDYTLLSIQLFLENKMRIIQLCKNPLLSETYEDYHAIYAFAYIIERYLFTEKLPEKLYCLSQKDLNSLRENDDLIDRIGNGSILN